VDSRLRSLSRSALTGDPESKARLLLERARSGQLSRERLELAAYCGDDAALAVLGDVFADERGHFFDYASIGLTNPLKRESVLPVRLDSWLSGLSRWSGAPYYSLVRAAVAAAWTALAPWCDSTRMSGRVGLHAKRQETERHGCTRCGPQQQALRAANEWLGCPCHSHQIAWYESTEAAYDADRIDAWLPYPDLWNPIDITRGSALDADVRIGHAVRLAGDQPVREAIQQALISWALGEK
jgi:hypothetical protein